MTGHSSSAVIALGRAPVRRREDRDGGSDGGETRAREAADICVETAVSLSYLGITTAP